MVRQDNNRRTGCQMRDLRVYMDVLSGSVFHYLDAGGLECDAVLHMRNGKYALVEIKLGGKELLEKGRPH